MSKLFKLKEWLIMPDAAKHLSIAFGEEVTEADVLRLALDGHLKLSVNFVNHAQVRCGKVVQIPEADLLAAIRAGKLPENLEWDTFPAEMMLFASHIPNDQKGKPVTYLKSLKIDSERYLNLDTNVESISGIWDLPMVGGERLDVEHVYQVLTGGPEITLETLEGAFVQRTAEEMHQLQESFEDNKFSSGSQAELKLIKEIIAFEKLDNSEAEKLLVEHKENRKKYLEQRKENRNCDYYPAGGLPRDAVYVVRTEELRRFEQRVSDDDEKALKTNERNTLVTIIAALCDYSSIDYKTRGAAQQIANMTEEIGAPITDDTIRKVLSKISDGVERRKK